MKSFQGCLKQVPRLIKGSLGRGYYETFSRVLQTGAEEKHYDEMENMLPVLEQAIFTVKLTSTANRDFDLSFSKSSPPKKLQYKTC